MYCVIWSTSQCFIHCGSEMAPGHPGLLLVPELISFKANISRCFSKRNPQRLALYTPLSVFLPSDQRCHSVTWGEEERWRADSLTHALTLPQLSLLCTGCYENSEASCFLHLVTVQGVITATTIWKNGVRSVFFLLLTYFWHIKCIILPTYSCTENQK